MQLVSRKNFIILLAAILIVGLGFFAINTSKKGVKLPSESDKEIKQIQTQSKSDNLEDIEKDLQNTDLNNIDKELSDIEKEINTSY